VQQIAGQLAQGLQQRAAEQGPQDAGAGIDDESRVFIAKILKSTEEVWSELFREHVQGGVYTPPKLVLFTDSDLSACGRASASMGPFYCPADKKVYIDPAFFDELSSRLKAGGDFAQAYVIAHEVAHHVQNQTGFMAKVSDERRSGDERMSNQLSVRLELQADFLAGVWAHHAQRNYNILEEGDIEEGINAANRIGDDTLQMEAQGYTVPERYTHGTSVQRAKWFKRGLTSGKFEDCEELFRIAYDRL
jgi:predicted metalloprotease